MKTTNQLKKYSSLVLALALVLPTAPLASASEANQPEINPPAITDGNSEEQTITEDQVKPETQTEPEIQTETPYKTSKKMVLAEDGKSAIYDIEITKNTAAESKLVGFIYLPANSNLENIRLINADGTEVKAEKKDSLEVLQVNLAEVSNIIIQADIKEGKSTKLFFDLAIIDEKNDFKDSHRVIGEIVETTEKTLQLVDKSSDKLKSVLTGSFVDDETIQWTDYLLNETGKEFTTEYKFEISSNQDTTNQKLNLTYYNLTNNGFEQSNTKSLDFGNIENLSLGKNQLVKISFQSKAKFEQEGINSFTINDATVKAEKKADASEVIKEDTKADYPEATIESENPSEKAKELTEEIKENSKEIDQLIVKNESKLEEPAATPKEEQVKPAETKILDAPSPENKTASETSKDLIEQIEKNAEGIEEVLEKNENSLKDEADPSPKASPAEVKTVVLTDDKENPKQKILTGSDVVRLTETLNKNMEDIQEVLEQNELLVENGATTVMDLKEEPKAPIPQKENADFANKSASEMAKYLIEQLEANMKEIDKLFKLVTDERAVNKLNNLWEKEAGLKVSNTSENKDLAKELEATKAEIEEVLRQIELSYEIKSLKDKPEDLEKIQALIVNLEKTEKAIESQTPKATDPVKSNFKRVVEGFSDQTYKDLKEIATVTLDPQKPIVEVTEEDKKALKEKYTVLNSYLETLELRKEIFSKPLSK